MIRKGATLKTIEIRDLPSGSHVVGFLFENPSHVYGLGDVLSVELPSGYIVDVGWDEDFPDEPFRIVVYLDYFGDRVVDFRVRDIDDVVRGVTQLALSTTSQSSQLPTLRLNGSTTCSKPLGDCSDLPLPWESWLKSRCSGSISKLMPRQTYLICSRLASEDRVTGLMSLYHVIEELVLGRPQPNEPIPPFVLRVTSAWMREEEEDEEQEYEYEINLRIPQGALLHRLTSGRLHFNTRFKKLMGDVFVQSVISDEVMARLERQSFMYVDSSIRPVGINDWQTYSYPISLIAAPAHPRGPNGDPIEPVSIARRPLHGPPQAL